MNNKTNFGFFGLLMLSTVGAAEAAVCTSLSAGRWDQVARWDCGRIPLSTDTVVIAHNNVQMRNNYTVAGITINTGAVLDDNGNNLTVNGNVVINGQLGTNRGGALRMRTAGATLSGTGTVKDITIEIDAANIVLSAGSTLDFDPNAEIDVGANMAGSLTINGTVTAATQTAGDRVIRVSSGGALTVGTTGVINAPSSRLDVRNNASLTNNGTVTIGDLRGRTGTPAPVITQGANAILNINLAACGTARPCTLNASAPGNTVNYSGAAAQTVLAPATTYANLTISGGGAKTIPTGLTVVGNFTMSGTATTTAPAALTVGGNFVIGAGNTFTPGTGTVTLNGTTAQTISGGATVIFNNLTITNATNPNLTLTSNVTVSGTLTGTARLTSSCPTDYTLTSTTPPQTLHSCSGPHHIQISHDGSALTCSPEIVTITACANALCTLPHYSGGANVTLTPGGLTFAIDATGVNSAATVQQSTVGAATLDAASVPAAISTATCWNTATSTASCAMTFNDSGFVVTVPNHTSCSNATATIEAVQAAPGTGRCVPAYQNVTRAVNLYSTYVSPATGTQVVTASTGVVSTVAPGTAHNLAFDATGKATIALNYPDAGQLTLTAGDTAPTGAAMTGNSTFVVAPASFAFSAIPAAPLTAGQAFNATVMAMNACATPAATPNFNGTVTITSSNPQPAIGNATAINTILSGFSNGAASTNLTWDEVGTIDLNANLANYLGSGLSVSGTQAGVGRFHPAYFDTVVTPGCNTFTYAGSTAPVKAGQPFTVTVKAKRFGGDATDATNTANYAGAAYAYLTTLSNAGITTGLATNTIAATSFVNGVGSANVTYEVATPQTVPLTLTMRAEDADPAPVSSSGHTEGAAAIRSGRLLLGNAHGSELLGLTIPMTTQYWTAGGYTTNTADNCTMIPASSIAMSSYTKNLAACETRLSPTGNMTFGGGVLPIPLKLSAPGNGNDGSVNLLVNVGSVAAGNTCIGATESAATAANAPWLTTNAVRATFGVYKGNSEFIYLREAY